MLASWVFRGVPVCQRDIESHGATTNGLPDIYGEKIEDGLPEWYQELGEDGLIGLQGIADAYVYLYQQQRNAWTHELDLRTHIENF